MKVSTERIPQSQIVLEIEVEPERVEKSLDAAYQRLARRASIPGFRKGKAPRAVVERYLGHDAIFHEALDSLIPEVYREAVDQEEIDPVESPDVEISSTEPLVFKATVPVRPTIQLGDYGNMRLPRDPIVVPEERVEEIIEELRHRYANLNPVDRPLQWNDAVRADITLNLDGRVLADHKDADFRLRENSTVLLPGLAEKIIGLDRSIDHAFEVDVPDDFGDRRVAGKKLQAKVHLHEVKEEELPPLDDAFARQVGEGFNSVEALRERLRSDLREAEEQSAIEAYRSQVISTLEETSTLEYPVVLVDHEIDHLLRDRFNGSGGEADMERYLQSVGKSEEALREELRPLADQRLRRSLLLSKVAEDENIQVEDAEVEQELERMAASAGPQAEQMRRLFDSPGGRQAISGSLLTRKTWKRLISIVSGEEPDRPAEGDAEAEPVETEQSAL